MLIVIEGIVMCFVLLVVCIVGLKNGPEKFVAFYGKDVRRRVVELGYTTEKEIKRSMFVSGIALFVPTLTLVPWMVYYLNDIHGFMDGFLQMSAVYLICGLFDRIFIDWYWVGYTKAWFIKGTEDLMPYISRKEWIKKWTATLIVYPLISAWTAWIMSLVLK